MINLPTHYEWHIEHTDPKRLKEGYEKLLQAWAIHLKEEASKPSRFPKDWRNRIYKQELR